MAVAPLKLVLGFSRGSASHHAAEAVAPFLARALGREIEFVWVAGESGARAARFVAGSAANGDTLLIATLGTHAILPNTRADCGYDPVADFAPVALLIRAPLILGIHPGLGVRTLHDLIALARSASAPLSFGSSAEGGAPHLAGALFASMAGIPLHHAVYNDTRQLYEDLTAGRIPLTFNNAASMTPFLNSGAVVGLAVTGNARLAECPALPTMAEAGVPGYALTNWVALLAPAGTSPGILAALSRAAGERAPNEVAALIKGDRDRLRMVVQHLGWVRSAV